MRVSLAETMMKKLYLLIVMLMFSSCSASVPAMSYLLVTRVGPCHERWPRGPQLVTVSEMSLRRVQHDSSLSGLIYIAEDIKNGWTVRATMQKCHDIRNLDTCDFYKSVPLVRSGCLDSEEAEFYTLFFQYITPQLECPLRAGNYTISDFPFFAEDSDLVAKSRISTSVFGYTYRLEGYDEDDERVLCVEAHLRLNYIRNHDWTGKRGASTTTRGRDGNGTTTQGRDGSGTPPPSKHATSGTAAGTADDDDDDELMDRI